jgi:hypothetical protein
LQLAGGLFSPIHTIACPTYSLTSLDQFELEFSRNVNGRTEYEEEPVVRAQQPFTACSALQNLIISTRSYICDMSCVLKRIADHPVNRILQHLSGECSLTSGTTINDLLAAIDS